MTVPAIRLCEHGPTFSQIIPGMMRLLEWRLTSAQLLAWIEQCLELGMTTFDHADIYGGYQCEAVFGAALALQPALRDQMQLVSKCGIMLVSPQRPYNRLKHYNTSAGHIITSAENSLRMLQTDRLDLLLIHRPDPLMNPDDIAEAFGRLRADGKVLYFGVSNFTPSQFDLLQSRLDYPLVTNQIELSVTHMTPLHDGSVDHLHRLRRAIMAWSPLGGGSIFRGDSEQGRRVAQALADVGAELGGAGADQVALAWLLAHPARILPVLGTGNLDRIRASAHACQLTLDRQQWFRIWQASANAEVP